MNDFFAVLEMTCFLKNCLFLPILNGSAGFSGVDRLVLYTRYIESFLLSHTEASIRN